MTGSAQHHCFGKAPKERSNSSTSSRYNSMPTIPFVTIDVLSKLEKPSDLNTVFGCVPGTQLSLGILTLLRTSRSIVPYNALITNISSSDHCPVERPRFWTLKTTRYSNSTFTHGSIPNMISSLFIAVLMFSRNCCLKVQSSSPRPVVYAGSDRRIPKALRHDQAFSRRSQLPTNGTK